MFARVLNLHLSEHLWRKCSLLCLLFRPASEKRVNERVRVMQDALQQWYCCLEDTAFTWVLPCCPRSWPPQWCRCVCTWIKCWRAAFGSRCACHPGRRSEVSDEVNKMNKELSRNREDEPGCETPAAVDRRPVCWGGGRVCGSAEVSGCPYSPKFPASNVGKPNWSDSTPLANTYMTLFNCTLTKTAYWAISVEFSFTRSQRSSRDVSTSPPTPQHTWVTREPTTSCQIQYSIPNNWKLLN